MEKLVYSIQEVAELLGISRSYAYELVRKGEIPVLMLGKKRVVPKEKFNRWVNGEEELEKYISEESFESWYKEFCEALSQVQSK